MPDAMHGPAYEHNGKPIAREDFYAIACDPRRSVAVEACAGAGKTWMLVSRMARALLAGAQPHEILAITFTKKAAGEMRQRLQEWLAAWAAAPPEQLHAELRMRGMRDIRAEDVEALKGLYARVLAAGRPVQIRTFHSWFAALLRSAPVAVLEQLGLPLQYELLEKDDEAVARVWRRFHLAVAKIPEARRDYEDSVAQFGRSQTLKALHAALARRVEFAMADAHDVVHASVRSFQEQYPQLAGLPVPEAALQGDVARRRWLDRAAALGAEKNKTPQQAAASVVLAFEDEDPAARLALLRKAFFVAAEDRLTANLTKYPAAQEAEAELQTLCAARAQHEAWLHHQRLARLTRLLLETFADLKREQGWVDMNDVERAALVMLGDPVLSGWVQERLDTRVRHLLVDEFQDTNPLQWQALNAWLSGYAGAGTGAPGVFIVGDPKQSIYRFRRAEPQVFLAAQEFIVQGLDGDRLACDHTHRNAPQVLHAVNQVLGQAQAQGEYQGFRPHTTESSRAGGLWALPQVLREQPAQAALPQEEWRDSLTVAREEPEEHIAALECRQAAAWIASQLAAGVPAGDIMVLARKRERLARMEAELRALHIPAQQPEKTDLSQAPEVLDLMALLDALASPTHDLSLAQALASPLFGIGDAGLAELARAARAQRDSGKPASWFELLQGDAAQTLAPALREAGVTLLRWKDLLERLPPHDALQAIYDQGDVLARFAQAAPAALREAVLANLRALLGTALQIRGGRYLTPYAFVRALKAGRIEGPALSVPGVVRLLTVHGAKGLEAPIVLLLDTDSPSQRSETMGVICEWPGEAPAPWRFAFLASESKPPACSVDALTVELAARRREELNALYVAMTRAQRQLVISSSQPSNGTQDSWWHRLLPLCEPLQLPTAAEATAGEIPRAFNLPVLPDVRWTVPATAAVDEAPASLVSRLGEAMHRLLEQGAVQGAFGPVQLRRVAREFQLDPQQINDAAAMALRILQGEGAWAWDADQIDWHGNEVELYYQGELLRMDRLVRRRSTGEWWVLDYKSAATPETKPELLEQMRKYCEAVRVSSPDVVVRTGFLTGQGRMVILD